MGFDIGIVNMYGAVAANNYSSPLYAFTDNRGIVYGNISVSAGRNASAIITPVSSIKVDFKIID